MPIESEADRRSLLVDDGQPIVISPPGGGSNHQVADGEGGFRDPFGVFDFEFEIIDMDIPIGSSVPAVTLPTAEVVGVVDGSIVTVIEGDFELHHQRPDGKGMTILILERAAPAPIGG